MGTGLRLLAAALACAVATAVPAVAGAVCNLSPGTGTYRVVVTEPQEEGIGTASFDTTGETARLSVIVSDEESVFEFDKCDIAGAAVFNLTTKFDAPPVITLSAAGDTPDAFRLDFAHPDGTPAFVILKR